MNIWRVKVKTQSFLMRTRGRGRQYSSLLSLLRLHNHNDSKLTAIVDEESKYTYRELYARSKLLANKLNSKLGPKDHTIGGYFKSESAYVVSMLATWMLGRKFVPLAKSHSVNEIKYYIEDSNISLVLYNSQSSKFEQIQAKEFFSTFVCDIHELVRPQKNISDKEIDDAIFNQPLHVGELKDAKSNNAALLDVDNDALVLYTSGTTGRPKGVLHTHNSLEHMMKSLCTSWEYSSNDYILHFLPLHHLHGVLNKLLCILWAGGTVEFLPSASAEVIWNRLGSLVSSTCTVPTVFMAVPTVYAKLIEAYSIGQIDPSTLNTALATLKNMRLHVSGSSALPGPILEKWKTLTGHTLLERYGMTEIGMALSNPYRKRDGERIKGHVGYPLPYVECKLVDDDENDILDNDIPGELRVKGPCVFKEYLNKPEAMRESFDADGWFKTGDVASKNSEGSYKLLGRKSVDIIKSSGYKLSALEIETELLSHPQIIEAAVIGVPDEISGERVVAIIAIRKHMTEEEEEGCLLLTQESVSAAAIMKLFLKDRLAYYKHPKEYIIVDQIPRNHIGKVNKKTLIKDITTSIL